MTALLALAWPKLLSYGLALFVALGAVFAFRRSGVKAERTAELERGVEARHTADKAGAEVAALGDSAVVDELQRKWSRP